MKEAQIAREAKRGGGGRRHGRSAPRGRANSEHQQGDSPGRTATMSSSRRLALLSTSGGILAVILAITSARFPDASRRIGKCPPILSKALAVLNVGENRTQATLYALGLSLFPWRPILADELGAKFVFDEHGRPLDCAADADEAALVYRSHGDLPWQWPSEVVGHTRMVSVRWFDEFEDGPPGTRETPLERTARSDATDAALGASSSARQVTLETLSASPPVFRARGLLPEAVLEALRTHAQPALAPSTVGDASTPGQSANRVTDARRTSRSAWLHGHNDPRHTLPAARAVQRVALDLLRHTPRSKLLKSVEPLLVVEYAASQFYEPHFDYFAGYDPSSGGSNRVATLLVYLEAPQDDAGDDGGGHTVFPLAAPTNVSAYFEDVAFVGEPGAPTCDFPELRQRRGLMVKPRVGDALFFYSQKPDGVLDERTRHGACPVRRGRKMAANVWLWNREVVYR